MIFGAHAIVYSANAAADRAFFRDVLGLPHVDAGEGWLIFGLPPAEVAVHPSEENDVHELYLMCDDVTAFVDAMEKRGLICRPVMNRGWGLLTEVTLPGGGRLGVYQPRHARPPAAKAVQGRERAPGRTPAPARAKAAPARVKAAPRARTRPRTASGARAAARKPAGPTRRKGGGLKKM